MSSTLDLLETIPGGNRRIAEVTVAETGADMDRFPTPAQLGIMDGSVSGGTTSPPGK